MIFVFAQYTAAVLVIVASLFSLLAAVGLWRLPDIYTRLHAAAKAGALGCGLVFLGIAVLAFDLPIIARTLVGYVFVLITTPISAHLLARAAIKTGHKPSNITDINELPK